MSRLRKMSEAEFDEMSRLCDVYFQNGCLFSGEDDRLIAFMDDTGDGAVFYEVVRHD